MRWYQRYGYYIISAAGYLLFVCTAIVSYQLLLSDRVGMDALIAFLLSQALGLLVLHFARQGTNHILDNRDSSRQYGIFLIVNALVILANALVMYVMDLMSDYNETSLQIFATGIMLCVNVIMQLLHLETLRQEEDSIS